MNNFDNPNTEKKAALNAISRADIPTNLEKFLLCSNMSFFLVIDNKYLESIDICSNSMSFIF